MSKEPDNELREKVRIFQDYTAGWGLPMNQEAHHRGLEIVLKDIQAIIDSKIKETRQYKLDVEMRKYLSGEQINAVGMVQAFANLFIQVMCVDTNATTATMKLGELTILGKDVGNWTVTAKRTKEPVNHTNTHTNTKREGG